MLNEKNSARPSLSDEQKLRVGEMAAQALNNPIFMIEHDMIMAKTVEEIDRIEPQNYKEVMWQKQKREVLREIMADLSFMVKQAELIYQENQRQNSPEYQENQRLNRQGFEPDEMPVSGAGR